MNLRVSWKADGQNLNLDVPGARILRHLLDFQVYVLDTFLKRKDRLVGGKYCIWGMDKQ